VVFSVTGDSFMRGSIRRMLAVAVGIVRGLLPLNYFDVSVRADTVVDVPALPGHGLYVAESKYSYYEAKCTQHRLDPRRIKGASRSVLDDWTDYVHAHIAALHRQFNWINWFADFEAQCKQCRSKFESIHNLRSRSKALLAEEYVRTYDRDPVDATTAAVASRPLELIGLRSPLQLPVRDAYLKVLALLRAADASKQWPLNSSGIASHHYNCMAWMDGWIDGWRA
jgi:hypothetical protein